MQINEGKLTDVGNHKLFNIIAGESTGLPAVIFEHGCGSSALFWSLVAPEIAKLTRVLVYDRAGYGWSEAGPFPRTNKRCTSELFELLQQENMKGPFILVGHSYGGLNMRLFTGQYPELVAGVVLVDAMHEDEVTDRFPEEHVKGQVGAVKFYSLLKLLSKIGVLQILARFKKFPGFSATISPFSKQIQDILWRISFQKKSVAAMHSEFSNVQHGYQKVRGIPQSNIPLIVLKAGIVNDFYPGTSEETKGIIREKLKEVAQDLKNGSANGKLIEVADSGHNLHIDHPQAVIDAVVELLRNTKKQL